MVGTNLFEEHDVILVLAAMHAFTLANDLKKKCLLLFSKSLHPRKKQFQIFFEELFFIINDSKIMIR